MLGTGADLVAVGKADCLTGGMKFTLLLRTACLTGGETTTSTLFAAPVER